MALRNPPARKGRYSRPLYRSLVTGKDFSMPQSATQVFRFEDLSAGQVFAVSESYGEREMIAFEMLSNDHSPLHVDAEATRQYGYPDRMVYGFLFLTLLSRFVGTRLHHAVCASISFDF